MLLLYQGSCKCIRRKNLIQLPVVLHHTPRLSANDRNEEYRALLDAGANSSFISTKRVKELGLEIDVSPFFPSAGRGTTRFWGNKQGRTVFLWEGLGEEGREECKRVIHTDRDWVVWS